MCNKFVCTKCFICMFSIFFVLCSLVILVMSTIDLMKLRYDFVEFHWLNISNKNYLEEVPITYIVISCFMFVIGLCAFGVSLCLFPNARIKARINSNSGRCMLLTFVILFLAILISLIVTMIYGIGGLPNRHIEPGNFQQSFLNYNTNEKDKEFVHNVQKELRCCGIYDRHDYENILDIPIPWSCCEKIEGRICYGSETFYRGCKNEIRFFFRGLFYYITILNVTVLSIAPVLVIAFVFAVIALILMLLPLQKSPGEIHSIVQHK